MVICSELPLLSNPKITVQKNWTKRTVWEPVINIPLNVTCKLQKYGHLLPDPSTGLEITAVNGQCPDWLRSWPVNFSSCRSCWPVTIVRIENETSCFNCYQYVASRCALRNVDLKSWVKYNYNRCLQFAHWNRHWDSRAFGHKIKNIFTFMS